MILQVTTSSWSWAGFGDSVLPFGRYKCYHWRSKGVKKVLKNTFFNSVKKMVLNCIFLLKYIFEHCQKKMLFNTFLTPQVPEIE